MARTTNSDTLPFVESRYELGMLASQRVRDLNGGATPVVERDGDKPTVVALREIASGKLDIAGIRHEFVQSYKETPAVENAEETLEVSSANPELRDIDAELEETLVGDEPVDAAELVAEDVMDDGAESDEE
ncbi:MAG: DNA-directed RNA polymerase subunit omega [Alphaproteobacteria bacterium]|jgi:DNA-directed RNA polymerase subunit omega|nr:DNA-directed RNA polymerase subunit omega [Alphaproteobacteria bacterium]